MSINAKQFRIISVISSIICISFITGCAVVPKPPYFKSVYDDSKNVKQETIAPEGTVAGKFAPPVEAKQPVIKIIEVPGPFKKETMTISPPPAKEPAEVGKEQPKAAEITLSIAAGDVQISVENMPVYDFITLVFGEVLKLNYTVTQDIQSAPEKITLNMLQKMEAKKFLVFVLDLLKSKGIEVKEALGILTINKTGSMPGSADTNLDIYIGKEIPNLPPQKIIKQIFVPDYLPSAALLQLIRQLQPSAGNLSMDISPISQAIILTGPVSAVDKVIKAINQFDRPYFFQREFSLLYLDYMNVVDFDKKLKEILPTLGIPIARSAQDSGLLTITFDKINALLLVYQKKEWLESVLYWKSKLDTVESMGDETQLFVFLPKNRPAADLVEVLNAVTSGALATPTPAQAEAGKSPTAAARTSRQSQPAQTTGVALLPGKNVNIIVDKGRNAVVISASPANYKLIKNILSQLDTQPKQVLIEATLMEITLKDNFQFGVEWFIKHHGNGYQGAVKTLGGLGIGSAGLSYVITQLGGDIGAQINASADTNLIKILSTPHIVVLDGKEATVNVGTEVPVVTSQVTAADIGNTGSSPSVLNSVQYRNTGVILHVKPVVNSEGILTVDINQELSEAQTNNISNISSPLILNRSISTSLNLKSGETVILGGLISENNSKTENKVPFLGDIPWIGHLFKVSSIGKNKTELIVELTPYILNDTEQLEIITKKFKEQYWQNKYQ